MNAGNKRATGGLYECAAASYLRQQGLQILDQNYRCRQGEIDLIAQEGCTLVFVEVKYRKTDAMGEPEEAVTPFKQRRIRNAAVCYLYSRRYGENTPCRFDVVSILGKDLRWIRDAF